MVSRDHLTMHPAAARVLNALSSTVTFTPAPRPLNTPLTLRSSALPFLLSGGTGAQSAQREQIDTPVGHSG